MNGGLEKFLAVTHFILENISRCWIAGSLRKSIDCDEPKGSSDPGRFWKPETALSWTLSLKPREPKRKCTENSIRQSLSLVQSLSSLLCSKAEAVAEMFKSLLTLVKVMGCYCQHVAHTCSINIFDEFLNACYTWGRKTAAAGRHGGEQFVNSPQKILPDL